MMTPIDVPAERRGRASGWTQAAVAAPDRELRVLHPGQALLSRCAALRRSGQNHQVCYRGGWDQDAARLERGNRPLCRVRVPVGRAGVARVTVTAGIAASDGSIVVERHGAVDGLVQLAKAGMDLHI